MNQRTVQRYGWRKDHLDARDRVMRLAEPAALPPSIDLRTSGFLPPVYDQMATGSCTANAIAAAVDFERKKQGEEFITPSRLFIYYNERVIEGDPDSDNGAEIRDGIKVVASQGVCPETEWPYSEYGFALKPHDQCYADALKFKALTYESVPQDAQTIRAALAAGRPVVFGFSVYGAFEGDDVAKTGIVPMPGPSDVPIGGHAVLAAGYDDEGRMFTVRNSWGENWGMAGYFKLPYDYLLNANLASDFWVIQAEM